MKRIPLFFALVFLFPVLPSELYAEPANGSMESCNTFYHDGSYQDAINCYQNISPGKFSSATLYNTGNSYAQLGQVGMAILNYQRALCLSPGDSDINGNLDMIKKEAGLFPPELSITEYISSLLSVSQWSLLIPSALVIYLVFSCFQLKKSTANRLKPL